MLLYSFSPNGKDLKRYVDLEVDYTGNVFWGPQLDITSECLIDVTNYPYDQQSCHIWFQSMTYTSSQLRLEPYPVTSLDLDTYLTGLKRSQEWDIIENKTTQVNSSRDLGVVLKFSTRISLKFSLKMQRRLGYVGYMLMLPCVILGGLSMIVFTIPPDRPDRHGLGEYTI